MKGPVRAKFRVLDITEKWDESWIAKLGPVMQRGSNSEENQSFWEASPSGECELTFHKEHELKVGAYYYIDMVPDEEGDWELGRVTKNSGGYGEVYLSHHRSYDYRDKPSGLLYGNLTIGIDGSKTKALDAFGEAGGKWKVTFTFAESSDGDNAYS
jgi:hypothetical protein